MAFLFEKLEVYQKSLAFAERVCKLTSHFPRGSSHLADQFNRASLSISLNIAEGNGRWSAADRRNFLTIARGSVHECVPIIELCRRTAVLDEVTCEALKDELETIAKMLPGLIGSASSKAPRAAPGGTC